MAITGPGRTRPLERRWLGLLIGGVLGIAVFLLGRLSVTKARTENSPDNATVANSSSDPSPVAQGWLRAHNVPKLAPLRSADTSTPTSDRDRKDTATFVVDKLIQRVEAFGHNPMYPTAEARAQQLRPFVQGLAEGIRQTRPDLFKALAEDFDDRFCRQEMSDDKTVLLSYLASDLPEMVSSRGLDCFFTRAKGKEDVPLWSMLDAWKASGLDKTSVLAQLQATAADERTIRRLMPLEEQMAARLPGVNSREAVPNAENHPMPTPAPSGQESPSPTPSRSASGTENDSVPTLAPN